MKATASYSILILTVLLQLATLNIFACSMCKVTINGKTYLGNNEDSWRMGSRIWFENGKSGKLGSLYVGYDNYFPQGGMNEAGLAFDGLTIYPKKIKPDPVKKEVLNPINFIKEIMQTCQTIEDVRRFASQYNREIFNGGELVFADKAGKYLVMEPDTMLIGSDDKYIIANFCPSITPDKEKLNWARYARGNQFLLNHRTDTNENFCLALVDTMHECRKKLGDGTLYSFVADLQEGDFSLYFYHDFKHAINFNLKEELAKGDHVLTMPSIFPTNIEFEKLNNYKTPQNSVAMLAYLYLCGGLFLFSTLFFLISYFKNPKTPDSYSTIKLLLLVVGVILFYYLTVLARNQAIFYSSAPYRDYQFSMQNIAAYIPFLLLLLIIPLVKINLKVFNQAHWQGFSKWVFMLNNLTYLTLIVLFAYWGLYTIF